MKRPKTTVSVIGMGNWGTSLVFALQAARVPLTQLTTSAHTPLHQSTLAAKVLWLCVPDRTFALVARRLVQRAAVLGVNLGEKIVVHSSGAVGSEALAAAARGGASVGSVHPMMSFPTRRVVPLEGVPFGIDADPGSRRVLGALVRSIGGLPFTVKAGNKALYHAVGMLASPLLVSHLMAAQHVAALAGFSPRQSRALIEPIAQATLTNLFTRGGPKSFSGPLARGDLSTIRLHLQSLEPHPMLAAVYRSLSLYALETLPAGDRSGLRRLLRKKEDSGP